MDRREAVTKVAWLLGGTVLGANLFVDMSCKPKAKKFNNEFDVDQVAFLDEVADTILPTTSTPGAKAAKVGAFMALMVQDCYTPEDQKVFEKGIKELDNASDKKFSKKFVELDPKQKTELLVQLDKEQKDYQSKKKPEEANHYFRMMKELTLLGYFTSEIGCTQALRYSAVPGRYDGCMPYKKGDKAWAT
ncbi:gluconate 2-dehydrogenase subunit 3 family protein [Pedobacter sp. HMF7647]|uniref:Gluconate 2-dehydrogenase subunit 3 family protein n=1 Tax=Hufsiella arboris TaxID=2695275 RepID=A0A7K1Y4E3_9SPHI|nr:gluconate 2-dehydrogenase subunit 3 family protein [Hufsiella arboris]MXV49445.1 gluconate 2-dehydrogenase subunit 3 family protein [Hufsiella arboris]